jgi:phosphatidylserine/phosphatidylglycerophosphate/cardiolipin synthase-like enzyme
VILVPGRTCWSIGEVEASGLLIDGEDYYREFVRAARGARRYILAAGWQFDSTVELLRGRGRDGDTRLLPFLDGLCRRNPELRVYLLCWDYSPGYMLQREWLQALLFNRPGHRRIRFRFDDRHALGASHHQKFVVIDGRVAFAGSMDLCADRWDDRRHRADNADRAEPGKHDYGPYHEVQAYLAGPAVADLTELFCARWRSSGGEELRLPPPPEGPPPALKPSVSLPADRVGFSRTAARTLNPEQPSIREIRQLHVDAIDAARELVYIENQYFGAYAVYQALLRRMSDGARPPLDVALLFPKDLHTFTEEFSMGVLQSAMFRKLCEVARRYGHSMGVYYSVSRGGEGREVSRYIHSKVMGVDDRFLSVGSANTNNRSMGLDTELNVSWEAEPGDRRLGQAIGRARANLLVEHTGAGGMEARRALRRRRGLVKYLDGLAEDPRSCLRRHPMTCRLRESPVLRLLDLDTVTFDPERPILEEDVFEPFWPSGVQLLTSGVTVLRRRLRGGARRRDTTIAIVNPPLAVARPPDPFWLIVSRASRRTGFLLFLLLLALLFGYFTLSVLRLLP